MQNFFSGKIILCVNSTQLNGSLMNNILYHNTWEFSNVDHNFGDEIKAEVASIQIKKETCNSEIKSLLVKSILKLIGQRYLFYILSQLSNQKLKLSFHSNPQTLLDIVVIPFTLLKECIILLCDYYVMQSCILCESIEYIIGRYIVKDTKSAKYIKKLPNINWKVSNLGKQSSNHIVEKAISY